MADRPKIRGNYGNITDIPLDNADHLRCLFGAWYFMQEAKYGNPGVQVVVLELEDIYYSAGLTKKQRDVIMWHLIEEKTQQETATEMGISPRSISRLVEQALDSMVVCARRRSSTIVPFPISA